MTEQNTTPAPEQDDIYATKPAQKGKGFIPVVVVLAVLLLAAGGWYWWQHQQLSAARRDADYFLSSLKTRNIQPTYKESKKGKVLLWENVTLAVPRGDSEPPMLVGIKSVRFDAGKQIQLEEFAVAIDPEAPEEGRVGLKILTISDYRYIGDTVVDYKTTAKGLLATGSKVDSWRGQLQGAALLLKAAPGDLKALPTRLLASLDNLSMESVARFDEAAKTYGGKTTIALPDFLTFAMDTTMPDMDTSQVLALSKANMQGALNADNKNLIFNLLSRLANSTYTVRLKNDGVVEQGVGIFAGLQGMKEDEARVALDEKMTAAVAKAAENPQTAPYASAMVDSLRKLLREEKDTLVFNITGKDALRAMVKQADAELKPKLLAANGDQEKLEKISKDWWKSLPVTVTEKPVHEWLNVSVSAE